MRTEHKRVKHGEQPGDVSRRVKIAMREKRDAVAVYSRDQVQDCNRAAKSFRTFLKEKSTKRQRRRDRETIEIQRGSGDDR